jgi:hypothetical protein
MSVQDFTLSLVERIQDLGSDSSWGWYLSRLLSDNQSPNFEFKISPQSCGV